MKIQYSLAVIIAIVIAACSSGPKQITYDKAPHVDFSKYKTYAFSSPTDTVFTRYVNKKQLENGLATEITQQLKNRNMTLDVQHPQCYFTYTLVMKNDYQLDANKQVIYNLQTYDNAFSTQPVYSFSPYNKAEVVTGNTRLTTLLDGSLVIDMIDASTNQVVWSSTMKGQRDVKELQGVQPTLARIIPEMFKKFPVKN